jgi:hypothetical protein
MFLVYHFAYEIYEKTLVSGSAGLRQQFFDP